MNSPPDSPRDLPLFSWQPPPRIVPFPSARRKDLIWRCARRMSDLKHQKAMEHLDRLIEQQSDVQARRGIDPAATATDVAALRSAILNAYSASGRRTDGGAAS